MNKTPLEPFYGVWEVLEELPTKNGKRMVRCKCTKCGGIVDKFLSNIKKPERQNHCCGILPTVLDGYTFGNLTVLHRDYSMPQGHECPTYHICQCNCPDKTIISVCRSSLISGKTKSCGSVYHKHQLKGEKISLIGKEFLKLKVLEATDKRASNKDIIYRCKCLNCGNENVFVSRSNLISFKKGSCGCLSKSHGEQRISELLIENNYSFTEQFVFENLPNRKFDFKVDLDTSFVLIEYDGEQHYNKNSRFYSEDGIKRDKEKNEYCLKNKIKLYRIPYWVPLKELKIQDLFSEDFLVKEKSPLTS